MIPHNLELVKENNPLNENHGNVFQYFYCVTQSVLVYKLSVMCSRKCWRGD